MFRGVRRDVELGQTRSGEEREVEMGGAGRKAWRVPIGVRLALLVKSLAKQTWDVPLGPVLGPWNGVYSGVDYVDVEDYGIASSSSTSGGGTGARQVEGEDPGESVYSFFAGSVLRGQYIIYVYPRQSVP